VLAALTENRFQGEVTRVPSNDSFIPLGDGALQVLLQEDTIEQAASFTVSDITFQFINGDPGHGSRAGPGGRAGQGCPAR
jgi:hypothetical protein